MMRGRGSSGGGVSEKWLAASCSALPDGSAVRWPDRSFTIHGSQLWWIAIVLGSSGVWGWRAVPWPVSSYKTVSDDPYEDLNWIVNGTVLALI